jgi:outer membrane receptor protein involved in Fe transport
MIDFGGSVSRFRGRYDYQDEVAFDLLFDLDGAPNDTSRNRALSARPGGRQYGVFSSFRFDLNAKLATELGVRWNYQSIDGTSSRTLGPRVGLRYEVSETMSFRASAGRFFQMQGIDALQINDGVTDFLAPQQADHFLLGLDRRLASGLTLRIEAYTKEMTNLRPRFENLLNSRVLLPELKPDRIRIAPESARARGLEFSLDGSSGSFEWWSSIAWSRVEDRVDEGRVLRSWDQVYALNAGFLWQLNHWSIGSGVIYRSGWPTTRVMLDPGETFPKVRVGSRNDERLKPYRSLDVRLQRTIPFERSKLDVFVELTNLTGRSNPCCVEYEVGDEEDEGQLVLDERAYLPTIPSVGFTWTF